MHLTKAQKMHINKLICKIFGHSKHTIKGHQKDMFGYEYAWQPEYCKRCGERLY